MATGQASEFEIIAELVRRLGGNEATGVAVASGDDGAVLEPGAWPVVTIDTLVEGVHWNPGFSTPRDVGFKLLSVGLSDLAAMGAIPGPMLLALTFGENFDRTYFDELVNGLEEALRFYCLPSDAVVPIGGDITRSRRGHVLTLTLFGRPYAEGKIFLRDSAQPGDAIWVSGPLGSAAAGLAILSTGLGKPWPDERLVQRHRRPIARQDLVPHLCEIPQIHAVIDLSDGLAGDIQHVLTSSKVGAEINLDAIPIEPSVEEIRDAVEIDPLKLALGGGEDFELLVTAGQAAVAHLARLGFSRIGKITAESELIYRDRGHIQDVDVTGFRHF